MWIDCHHDPRQNVYVYNIGYVNNETYINFYKWHNTKKLHYSYSDMPHDYFVYLHEEDRLELHEKYSQYITIEDIEFDPSWMTDCTLSPSIHPLEVEWARILAEEIQKEINKEIIETIKTNEY